MTLTEAAKDTARRWTSRQFVVTLVGIGSVLWATMADKDVGALAGVVMVAIGGAAGVNWKEGRQS